MSKLLVRHRLRSFLDIICDSSLNVENSSKDPLLRQISCSHPILRFRRRVGAPVVGHPQLPVQVGPAARTALHLLGQARLGAVLLQGGPPRGERAHAQEPAGTEIIGSFNVMTHVTPFHSFPDFSLFIQTSKDDHEGFIDRSSS